MKSSIPKGHFFSFLLIGLLGAGCSPGGSQGSEKTDRGETVETNLALEVSLPEMTSTTTTTTIVKDPQVELDALAFFGQAKDYSKIVETDCGKFALLVQSDRVSFYKWVNNIWADNSEVLGPDGPMIPRFVKSYDFTGDSVLDLFIQYEDPETSDPIGAMFVQDGCLWNWSTFDNGDYVSSVSPGLAWIEKRQTLEGFIENYDGYKVPFTVNFDQGTGAFVVEMLPFQAPPPACVAAFDLIKRKNYDKTLYSWFYYVWDNGTRPSFTRGDWYTNHTKGTSVSLARCRREDWIAEANRRRSRFNNHTDAQYYGEKYVLLSDENASAILKELCTLTVYFGDDEVYAYRESRSIACEDY